MSRGISAIVVIRQALGGDGFVYEILVSKCGSESMPLREDTASEVTIIAAANRGEAIAAKRGLEEIGFPPKRNRRYNT
jgi:hypothetical protein